MRYWLLLLCVLIPLPSLAAVLINEVAWMGSVDSANHEWIELYNTGSAVNVEGWILTDGMNLTIPLSGTIEGNSYAVLERTSDESAPGSAFLVYTGALVNTGATLVLKRADGGIEDQVAGGENWQSIGGDNVTKETAQYTTSGWITAAGTPRAVNRTNGTSTPPPAPAPSPSTNTDEKPTTKSTGSRDTSETVRFILPPNSLSLTVAAQKVGYVQQGIVFEATPSGIGRSLAHSIVYRWNFGDGNSGFGKNPTHHYQYPGTYVVTLYASVGTQEHLSRHEITILPVTVSLTTNESGDIQINNDSPYEIDISGYQVRGADSFIFPEYSILLPNQTITIPKHKIGSSQFVPSLYNSLSQHVPIRTAPTAVLASARTVDESELPPPTPLVRTSNAVTSPATSRFSFATTSPVTPPSLEIDAEVTPANTTILSAVSNTDVPKSRTAVRWPYLALAGLLFLCFVAIFLKPNSN